MSPDAGGAGEMSGQVVPIYPWVQPYPVEGGYQVSIDVGEDGPTLTISGRPPSPDELMLLGRALVDAGRAVRNGDDPAEVVRSEWARRRARPRGC